MKSPLPPKPDKSAQPLGYLRASRSELLRKNMVYGSALFALSILLTILMFRLIASEGGILDNQRAQKVWMEIRQNNQSAIARNAKIATEVADLRSGQEIIESHARYDYLLIRPNEDYFRFVPANTGKLTNRNP